MTKLNILIVEDESLLALELAHSITNYGHHIVDYVTTPKQAIETFKNNTIDLLIMDINLGDTIDGIELYKTFQQKVPVIYLTAYKDDKTISKAIETEPLGYLVKPHNESELFALLKLAEIKVASLHQKIILGDGYSFDKEEEKLFYNSNFIKLSQKELALLELLLDAKGNIVTFSTIEYELWEDQPSASALRTLIYRLRGKLAHKFIKTEQKHGIKLDF